MGILNLTPDSFYDGGKYNSDSQIHSKLKIMDKCSIIDVGAESSRPGSYPINEKEEIDRLNNFIGLIKQSKLKFLKNKILSIDSYKTKIIKYCINNGFSMINDISGGGIKYENIDLACNYNIPIVIMHKQGHSFDMQENPKYDNIIDDLMVFFDKRINYSEKIGLNKNKIILDPGIGFGKSIIDNNKIILNINKFKKFGCKLLIGISRKSFLSVNNDTPKDRLPQSLGIGALCAMQGVDILRVHDVEETNNMLQIINNLKN